MTTRLVMTTPRKKNDLRFGFPGLKDLWLDIHHDSIVKIVPLTTSDPLAMTTKVVMTTLRQKKTSEMNSLT